MRCPLFCAPRSIMISYDTYFQVIDVRRLTSCGVEHIVGRGFSYSPVESTAVSKVVNSTTSKGKYRRPYVRVAIPASAFKLKPVWSISVTTAKVRRATVMSANTHSNVTPLVKRVEEVSGATGFHTAVAIAILIVPRLSRDCPEIIPTPPLHDIDMTPSRSYKQCVSQRECCASPS